jgi:hypothetical protein
MSLGVMLKHNNTIYLASDGRLTRGSEIVSECHEKTFVCSDAFRISAVLTGKVSSSIEFRSIFKSLKFNQEITDSQDIESLTINIYRKIMSNIDKSIDHDLESICVFDRLSNIEKPIVFKISIHGHGSGLVVDIIDITHLLNYAVGSTNFEAKVYMDMNTTFNGDEYFDDMFSYLTRFDNSINDNVTLIEVN